MEQGFLRLKQIVPGMVPVARSTWWRWIQEGRAPRGLKIGQRTTVWRREDIEKFIAAHGGGA